MGETSLSGPAYNMVRRGGHSLYGLKGDPDNNILLVVLDLDEARSDKRLEHERRAWPTGFGIASRLAREHQLPGPPDIIAGTLADMAPVQTGRMNRATDSRSDLYVARAPVPPNAHSRRVPEQVSSIAIDGPTARKVIFRRSSLTHGTELQGCADQDTTPKRATRTAGIDAMAPESKSVSPRSFICSTTGRRAAGALLEAGR